MKYLVRGRTHKLMLLRLTSLDILPAKDYDVEVTHLEINGRNRVYLWDEKKRLDILTYNTSYLENLRGLGRFPRLKRLTCQNISLKSLEGARECPYLETIKCDDCAITSLEGLFECKKIKSISCQGNNLTSLTGIQHLPDLSVLICNDNLITSLKPVRGLCNLRILRCQGNFLSSLKGLEECHKLDVLTMKGNPLVSLEGLPTVPELITYDRKSFLLGYDFFRQFQIARLSHAFYRVYHIVRPKLEQKISRFQKIWQRRHYEEKIRYKGEVINRLCYLDIQ